MSSYICRREEWEKVIKAWINNGEAMKHMPDEEEFKRAWREIVTANYDAVNNRYPDHKQEPSAEDLKAPKLVDIWYRTDTKKELYDAIKEYMYQVADLDHPGEREAYYKCRWCLDKWLDDYITDQFGED